MHSNEYNKNFLTASLKGTIEAKIYGEDGKLKRTHVANNVVTTNGINRLVDMLIDGYDNTSPKAWINEDDSSLPTATLKSYNDFEGGIDGEIFGINKIEWSGRDKSTFTKSGHQDSAHFKNTDKMFNNRKNQYSKFYAGYNENQYWTPQGEDSGWICDLGYTEITNKSWTSGAENVWKNLDHKNLYYLSVIVKSDDLATTYVNDLDYEWETGDGDNYGRIKILSGGPANVALRLSYIWYDVPQVPIVGFMLEAGGNEGQWDSDVFFNAWRWSLNQGESRTRPFFPNYNGNPKRPGWQAYHWSWPWYPRWGAYQIEHGYFMNSLPWAVKNPVQLSWHGNHGNSEKWIFDFQLLGLKMPKLGVHAIGLGTGSGTPGIGDTALFSENTKVITQSKNRDGTIGMKIVSYLDYNEANDVTFTEAGLFHSTDDSVYFKEDEFWSGSENDGFSGEHSDFIKGNNKILKLSQIEADDCDAMSSHAMFDSSWSKTSSERVELVYNLTVYWS